ncbi:emopamil binding protein [Colletotrichum karsti]|uniref:Emopamil binding protein n=1 Tax=Colletotrichum karsti TaxID=1095194 RepID=A0A9P6IAD2_9PEZI|nr:emopamil binding protein [Colletotrichum karsti]KAF9880073.1 emopamil binding protein [Colletotrichum karsti]
MAAQIIMNDSVPLHPYFPLDTMLPGYAENKLGALALCSTFAAGTVAILAPTYKIIRRTNPNLSNGEVATALWFVLCGFIHFFFEGYFAYNQSKMPSMTDIFGELWKEYSKSDSRYLTQDSFVVCMESITALFWGPMSFACAWCVVHDHPLRHPLQAIVSLGQLYGDVLYYATCTFEKLVERLVYCRPEDYYFYGYYVLMNAFWIVIPFGLLVSSSVATKRAFARVKEMERAKGKKML